MNTVNAKMKPSVRKLYEERLLNAQDTLATLMTARDNLQAGIEQVQDEVVALERKLQDDDVAGMKAPQLPGYLEQIHQSLAGAEKQAPMGEATLTQLCRKLAEQSAIAFPGATPESRQVEIPTPNGMIAVPFSHMVEMMRKVHQEKFEIPEAFRKDFMDAIAEQSPTTKRQEQVEEMLDKLNIDDPVIAAHVIELLANRGYDVDALTPLTICELTVRKFPHVQWRHRLQGPTEMTVHIFRTPF